ncbi:hypothetical protein [Luteolibacter luteus]|uniref:HEAT repeat domain-containing protein n=1 Tax=Luteolibacter luteus TaxID=2728835 RepID=A0A858RMR2_9BACT|nr:hypothetical protein [Luteolibacter luteus]QJE98287.1 hypothetical protein HHL09_21725 [Luteolibacter luteus]
MSPMELPGKPVPVEAREFRQLSDPERAALEALISAYKAAEDHSERDRILDRIEDGFYGQEVLGLALLVFENRDRFGVSQVNRVTTILAGNTSPQILPVLKVAYDRASDAEKARLLMAAARVEGDGLPEFVARGFEDNSSNVRFAAFDVVDHQDPRMKKVLLLAALRSSKSDVALAGLGELEVDATPDSLPIIMEGLSSRNSEVREETRGTLQFLLDEEFRDSEAAAQWWQQNRHRFDRNLIRAN